MSVGNRQCAFLGKDGVGGSIPLGSTIFPSKSTTSQNRPVNTFGKTGRTAAEHGYVCGESVGDGA